MLPSRTVPVMLLLSNVLASPPTTAAGHGATEITPTGWSSRVAVLLTPLYPAKIVTGVVAETDDVVIVKTGDAVAPAATVTEAGTPTPRSLVDKLTTMPPAGAGAVRFTLFDVVATQLATEAC